MLKRGDATGRVVEEELWSGYIAFPVEAEEGRLHAQAITYGFAEYVEKRR